MSATSRGRGSVGPGGQDGLSVLAVLLVLVVAIGLVTWAGGSLGDLGAMASRAGTSAVNLVEGGEQARALRQMRAVARANARLKVERGRYAASIAELRRHHPGVPERDPWGHRWDYDARGDGWRLRSYGADGVPGPAPPAPWRGGHEASDLIMDTGQLVQAPQR